MQTYACAFAYACTNEKNVCIHTCIFCSPHRPKKSPSRVLGILTSLPESPTNGKIELSLKRPVSGRSKANWNPVRAFAILRTIKNHRRGPKVSPTQSLDPGASRGDPSREDGVEGSCRVCVATLCACGYECVCVRVCVASSPPHCRSSDPAALLRSRPQGQQVCARVRVCALPLSASPLRPFPAPPAPRPLPPRVPFPCPARLPFLLHFVLVVCSVSARVGFVACVCSVVCGLPVLPPDCCVLPCLTGGSRVPALGVFPGLRLPACLRDSASPVPHWSTQLHASSTPEAAKSALRHRAKSR